jgi:mRNA-degrading endonuclease RelE of RelBE toxin-antitoxin system
VVDLIEIELTHNSVNLHIAGVDLLEGTPVLDIKPYLPYVDAITDAKGGYAPNAPGETIELSYSSAAKETLKALPAGEAKQLQQLILRILQNDPRPAYLEENKRNRFGMRLYNYNIRWQVRGSTFLITELRLIEDHTSE